MKRSTLQARLKGRRSAKESQQTQQRLSVEEEDSIKRCLFTLTAWGWPATVRYLESLTTGLLQAKRDFEPLGQNWYKNFLARHPDLKAVWSRSLDQSRKDAVDHSVLQEWFKLYRETCATFGIPPEDRYNMDEKGFMKGIGDDAKVIISVGEQDAFSIQPGNREWVSVIKCIGVNGFSVPSFVIFQGQRIQESWVNTQMDKRTVIRVSNNGWTDREIALEWVQHFDQYTKTQIHAKYRLLILDGHTSHVSLPFIQYCEEHYIVPLCLPPHSTHILQPLDVGIFFPLAKAYKKRIQQHSMFGAERITNEQFLTFFELACEEAISSRNIASAWRATGLDPYNPSPILQKYRPLTPPIASLTSSDGVRLEIPVTQPDLAQEIDAVVSRLVQVCSSPYKADVQFLKRTALTAIADRDSFSYLNQQLVDKSKESRQRKTKKHFGAARVLTVEDALERKANREAQEQKKLDEKERKAALRGVVTFAKKVWSEGFRMNPDIFT